ncbi:MAG: hypothetical protein LBM06_06015 [Prevotellaceae bacterium]|nr:hypothetical protein [Prevotellaceae bacterium]
MGTRYTDEHKHYAYPDEKYDLEHSSWATFIYEDKHCVAYRDKKLNKTTVFANPDPWKSWSFKSSVLMQDGCFYFVADPGYLSHLLDERLMSQADLEKVRSLKEDDNPVIVVYRMKNP